MSDRLERLERELEKRELDALLVTNLFNVRYLTGFSGTNGLALFARSGARKFLTDFRYVEQTAKQVTEFDAITAERELLVEVVDLLGELGSARVGFDDTDLSVKSFRRLQEAAPDAIELKAAAGVVEKLRTIKEPGEIEKMRAACAIADEVFDWAAEQSLVGKTERAVAAELEYQMRLRGAEAASFPIIVASGAHGALPHAEPRDVAIENDTLVVLDMGALYDGYCSDCTRTLPVGNPNEEMGSTYNLVLAAQEAALSGVQAGANGRAVDAIARDLITEAGFGEFFGHGLGHGVGLEVHEAPRLSKKSDDKLAEGNAVTVEPGIYLPGKFGVRIEELVVVGVEGPEVLTKASKAIL